MSTYIVDDTKTMLMMNQSRWYETLKHIHDFNETLSMDTRYNLLFQVDDIMRDLQINYWLTNGTALGLIRDNQLIPWDDDIDIDVYSEILMPKFQQMVMSLVNNGFVCRVVERGATSKVSIFKDNFKISIGGIYLDGDYRRAKSCHYPKKFYENSIQYKIKDKEFNIPGPVDEYLSYLYKDWKTPTRSDNVREYNQDYLYK
jgi:lipopolysaccharide cholinephosphotransferase